MYLFCIGHKSVENVKYTIHIKNPMLHIDVVAHVVSMVESIDTIY